MTMTLSLVAVALTFLPSGLTETSSANVLRPWRTLRGHSRLVRCLAYAPDGRLASGGQDRRICLWDSGGKALHHFEIPGPAT
jgi:WD40 repeat protein